MVDGAARATTPNRPIVLPVSSTRARLVIFSILNALRKPLRQSIALETFSIFRSLASLSRSFLQLERSNFPYRSSPRSACIKSLHARSISFRPSNEFRELVSISSYVDWARKELMQRQASAMVAPAGLLNPCMRPTDPQRPTLEGITFAGSETVYNSSSQQNFIAVKLLIGSQDY
jgi:hypothetical protein